ncbi:ATP-binding protein [Paeniglutamicibacter terrestris]|uniref:AAA family ATPase n=1 Tax=Paeniglutamicibacter terrestris TaxID=2723403 RepID=A0ABX1G6L3_9MICC|nr:ATP-binding protein [Paeniglutamicibacter terrestris]NKG21062.1 AAA family ATPase [Paeniglutamicibacter terrestris]
MGTTISEATLVNFQRVSYAKIHPSGNLIAICGKNESGKTSKLDGLQAAICGHSSRDIKRPIKDGHGKASIELKLTDGSTLIRGYTPSGSTLRGIDAAGEKFGQREIDARLSSLGIDGRKFISMGEKDQLAALLSIVDLPFKPAELDAERKALESKRLQIGQAGKAIGDFTVDPSLPTEQTSAVDLIAAIRAGHASNEQIDIAEHSVQHWANEVEHLKASLEIAERNLVAVKDTLASAPGRIDTAALDAQLSTIEETNAAIRANENARSAVEEKASLRAAYEALTDEIKAIDKRKADGLANAEMPIEGMSFDEEGVLYQGVPFSRASGAKQLILSAAMIMATDPEIRVIVIRDGNVLDMENLAILQDMAEATDFQVFIEIVRETKGEEEYFFVEGELDA